jgi:N-acetylglutamate synthase-like GNAT family acetyltransferase
MSPIDPNIRDMASTDLERVAELDAMATGLTRTDFFRRRWQAMEDKPDSYIGLIEVSQDSICGFVLGHILTGEFGTRRKLAIIDSIAVTPVLHGSGIGAQLMNAIKERARELGCAEIRTLAGWDRQDLLGFFAKSGFSLLPVTVLEKNLQQA